MLTLLSEVTGLAWREIMPDAYHADLEDMLLVTIQTTSKDAVRRIDYHLHAFVDIDGFIETVLRQKYPSLQDLCEGWQGFIGRASL